jgi:hypothetical protein
MDDIAIRTFGDVAIVTARQIIMHDDGRTGHAGPVKQDGHWLREAAQVSVIAD